MATKNPAIADLNLAEIATANGISQSKVKEIAIGLSNEGVSPTPELIAQVVSLYTEKRCDPMLAIEEVAKQVKSQASEECGEGADDPLSASVNLLADQIYAGLSPLAPLVRDVVTARLAIEVASGIATGDSFRRPGAKTKAVFSAFEAIAKAAGNKLPSPTLQASLAAAKGDNHFFALAASTEKVETA